MVSKKQITWITSLHQKKYRQLQKQFIAESVKVIQEFLQSNFVLEHLFVTENGVNLFKNYPKTVVSESEMKKISTLSSPSNCLAVFKMIEQKKPVYNGLIVVLDDIKDPGNFGTIIRLCDWFGVEQLICTLATVDVFNPKVIQSSMGSMSRVEIIYCDVFDFIKNATMPVYGTFMNGNSIYSTTFPENAILVFGNEANGISSHLQSFITERISIPRFGKLQLTESLNVATASAIVLSEFCRAKLY